MDGSRYSGLNYYSKCTKEIQQKSTLIQVNTRFELARCQVIASQLYHSRTS